MSEGIEPPAGEIGDRPSGNRRRARSDSRSRRTCRRSACRRRSWEPPSPALPPRSRRPRSRPTPPPLPPRAPETAGPRPSPAARRPPAASCRPGEDPRCRPGRTRPSRSRAARSWRNSRSRAARRRQAAPGCRRAGGSWRLPPAPEKLVAALRAAGAQLRHIPRPTAAGLTLATFGAVSSPLPPHSTQIDGRDQPVLGEREFLAPRGARGSSRWSDGSPWSGNRTRRCRRRRRSNASSRTSRPSGVRAKRMAPDGHSFSHSRQPSQIFGVEGDAAAQALGRRRGRAERERLGVRPAAEIAGEERRESSSRRPHSRSPPDGDRLGDALDDRRRPRRTAGHVDVDREVLVDRRADRRSSRGRCRPRSGRRRPRPSLSDRGFRRRRAWRPPAHAGSAAR